MKKIYSVLLVVFVATVMLSSTTLSAKVVQSVQVYTTDNSDGKVTAKSIAAVFEEIGLSVSANNDMNNPFGKRFPKVSFGVLLTPRSSLLIPCTIYIM